MRAKKRPNAHFGITQPHTRTRINRSEDYTKMAQQEITYTYLLGQIDALVQELGRARATIIAQGRLLARANTLFGRRAGRRRRSTNVMASPALASGLTPPRPRRRRPFNSSAMKKVSLLLFRCIFTLYDYAYLFFLTTLLRLLIYHTVTIIGRTN